MPQTMQRLKAIPPREHNNRIQLDKNLETCKFVFVKKPLKQPYEGSYQVIKRTNKHFTINKCGKKETIAIDKIKPAFYQAQHNKEHTTSLNQPRPATTTTADIEEKSCTKPTCLTRSGRAVTKPKRYIFKDIETLPDKTACQRKPGSDNYRPPASSSQTHHNPNGRKVKSDSKRTSILTILPSSKNSSESPKVQNPGESNPDVGGVHPLKNVDLDSTRSSCADEEWDNIIETPVSATPGYSNCAMDNRKTNHNIHITDHALNVDIFEPRKPSQVCLTVHNPLQIMKKPKSTTNLGNKRLKYVTHTVKSTTTQFSANTKLVSPVVASAESSIDIMCETESQKDDYFIQSSDDDKKFKTTTSVSSLVGLEKEIQHILPDFKHSRVVKEMTHRNMAPQYSLRKSLWSMGKINRKHT
ncbi:unnamed protein product [Schistosoma margrebowiei]|uniref:Uncharacterized protein n=1 Tax=Schistosoma margrebowiei TaxID=48269 RepID=A0A3P8GW75_9TREM|nr:unnamed protein product [Schistosoma margrebowiei]